MKRSKITLFLSFSMVLILCFSSGLEGNFKNYDSSDSPAKKIFTFEDSLSLEALGHNSAPRFSCQGDFIAYAVTDRYYERAEPYTSYFFVPQGSHIFVHNLHEGQTIQLTQGREYAWSPSWSPDGRKLAFYVWYNKTISIGIWDRMTKQMDFHEMGNLFGRRAILWSPQSDKMFFFVSEFDWKGPLKPYEDHEDPMIRMSWEKVNPFDGKMISYGAYKIACFDIKTKRIISVMPEVASIFHGSTKVSPDGKKIAVIEIIKNRVRVALVPTITRLIVYPVEKGEPEIIATDSEIFRCAWSPEGRFIAYVDKGKLRIYSFEESKSVDLGKDEVKVAGEPIWHPQGKHILCSSGDDYYLFNVATREMKKLEINVPYAKQKYLWDKKGDRILIKTLDQENGEQGIYRVSWKKGNAEKLIKGNWMINNLTLMEKSLAFTLQNATTPENIWTLNLKTKERQKITDLNKQASDFSFGKSVLISWKNLSGDLLKGVLLYPSNYEQGKRYPVVCEVYSTFSGQLHRFFLHLYNLQLLANRGYAVFLLDLKFYKGDLPRSYIQCVEPALDRLVEIGIADGNFGIMGHSFGGYGTNVLATHSKRFKAAVALSGMSNLISYHGTLTMDYGRGYTRGTNELGGGKLGADPRLIIDRYIKNSPVFFLHQVQTPLMLIHGTADWTVPFSQAEEMYYGLRHLGKPAVLVGYPGEGHLWYGTKIRVFKDMWQRMLSWFDKYMKAKGHS